MATMFDMCWNSTVFKYVVNICTVDSTMDSLSVEFRFILVPNHNNRCLQELYIVIQRNFLMFLT